ncbi:hypothetical protein AB1Y20_010098 [Prymnesium parvum]|uniref:Uncharacterized protein n=1 Tax=Prymnesium parvum TaxID=97485 RepID=A0AB34K3X8_PRYPA
MGAPCAAPHERWAVRLSFDRSAASERSARAWVRRLPRASTPQHEHSAWGRYLRSVYSAPPLLPVDVRALRWFWWWAPGARNLTRLEMPVWRRLAPGDVWLPGMRIERHLSRAGFFLQPHEAARAAGLPDHGHAEVMRVSHPAGEGPSTAYGPEAASTSQVWYWHAPGSGIYLSLGRTLAVANRSALLDALCVTGGRAACPFVLKRVEVPREVGLRLCEGCTAEPWRAFDVVWRRRARDEPARARPDARVLCDLVRARGFDTVQLYAAFGGQRFELVDCRVGGAAASDAPPWTSACAPPELSRHIARPGARGAWLPCNCSSALAFLNCGACASPAPVLRLQQPNHPMFTVVPPHE